MIEINGVAHTVLTVKDVERSRAFYEPLLTFLGLKKVADGKGGFYFVGGKTALAISQCAPEHKEAHFEQTRVGLHHLCFRARTRDDVNKAHAQLQKQGAHIVHAPEEGPWAPGYYSVLFEDPDGIRLEINYVPGKGLFEKGVKFNPAGYDMTPR
jgi:catechol 2,3-dioxygenase-like lactoylglutathione lyase family enzyme